MFRFEELNAFTAQIRGNKIDFFYGGKFPYMTTERLYSYNNGKYLWGGCFTQGSLLFSPKRHMFRFEQLNAFTAQIKGNEIDFFYSGKFHGMTTEHLYSYNNGKYFWGGCFTQGSLLLFTKASYVPF